MGDALVDAALELFFREGFSSLTMEGIAARLGVSKATLYKYFANKDAVLDAALERYFGRMTEKASQLDRDAPYPERLGRYLRHVEEVIRPAAPVLTGDILSTTPWAWERIALYRREVLLARLRELLEEGRDRGFLRGDLDAAIVPALYTAIVDQIARPDFLLGWNVGFEQLNDSVVQILLGGILSDEGRRQLRQAETWQPLGSAAAPSRHPSVGSPPGSEKVGGRLG